MDKSMARNLSPWTLSWGDVYTKSVAKHHLRSFGIALTLLSASFLPAAAQRPEPAGIHRAALHEVFSPFHWPSDTAGGRTISLWPMVIGAAMGAGAGWAAGRFYQGQCETPSCSRKAASYDTDGLLVGAGIGLITGILVGAIRSRSEDR